MAQRKYKLKEGIVLKPYGVNSRVDNDNLTDQMAELLISKGKAKKEQFIIKKTNNGNNK